MKLLFHILTIILAFHAIAYGQQMNEDNMHFKVGEKMPELTFKVNNYLKDSIRLSDFKGKTVILEMWGVYCGGCIKGFPKLEELQRKYKDKIQIFLVTKNSTEEVRKLSLKSEVVRSTTLPMINGEESLASLFDYKYLPTNVWLKDGTDIQYITGVNSLTMENIEKISRDAELNVEEKIDLHLIDSEPYFTQLFSYIGIDPMFYTFFTKSSEKYNIGFSQGIERDNERESIRKIYARKSTIRSLYKIAFQNIIQDIPYHRILFNIDGNFIGYHDANKLDNEYYIFDLKVNGNFADSTIHTYMRRHLDLNLNLNSSFTVHEMPCLILKQLSGVSTKVLFKNTEDPEEFDAASMPGYGIFKNMPWRYVESTLNGNGIVPPYDIIDETGVGIDNKVSFTISFDFDNIDKIRESLRPYGLTVDIEYRTKEVIVLSR